MFSRISSAFSSLYKTLSAPLSHLFSSGKIDAGVLSELEKILLQADTGVITTNKIISQLSANSAERPQDALLHILMELLQGAPYQDNGDVIICVGINGAGKTTSVAKLAALLQAGEKKVLLAAADTFRAAAVDQLQLWADKLSARLITGAPQQDPSAVVYQACAEFKKGNYSHLIIDTAGRLQTKAHLMKELEKIHRTVIKQLPEKRVTTLLVIDSMLGQNSFDQVTLFNAATKIDGIILTKTDGTGKGGIVFAIVDKLKIPLAYVTFGEQLTDIAPFDAQKFVRTLLGNGSS